MRMVLAFLVAVLSFPAVAQDWERYENARYGYSLAIPPGFEGQGESDNGDGQVFTSSAHNETLTVWASMAGESGFAMDALEAGKALEDAAWHVGTQTIHPADAQLSAIQGIRTLRQRMQLLCEGQSIVYIRLDHPVTASAEMDKTFKRLVRSLDPGDC